MLRCQLELNAVRQEIERCLAEKEEEFLLIKKAQSKALDSMQSALETESKSRGAEDEEEAGGIRRRPWPGPGARYR